MNLFEMLHKDHEKVAELFAKLESAGEAEESHRQQLFSSLHRELDVHSQAEEKFFYSQLRGEDETRELVLEAQDEHKEVRRMLEELAGMDAGSAEFTARLRACRESVEHHVAEEENELFPRARKVLDEDVAAGIAEDIEAYKEEHSELSF